MFDGVDDYIQLPLINNIRAIELKIDTKALDGSGWKYMLDARDGLAGGGYFAAAGIGGNWIKMYINGTTTTVNYTNVPKNEYVDIYIESDVLFNDNVNILSRLSNNEFMQANIYEIRLWGTQLLESEVQNYMNSYKVTNAPSLLASYKVENNYANTLLDISGNNNNAVINGNPEFVKNSGIKEIRIKQGATLINSSTNSTYTFNLISGNYTIEVEDNTGNISTKNVTI